MINCDNADGALSIVPDMGKCLFNLLSALLLLLLLLSAPPCMSTWQPVSLASQLLLIHVFSRLMENLTRCH